MKKINLSIFIALAVIGLCTVSAKALSPEDSTSDSYLKNHGYSPEMIRLVNLQKGRFEKDENTVEEKAVWYTKPVKAVKQWFRTSDCTMTSTFGDNRVKF